MRKILVAPPPNSGGTIRGLRLPIMPSVRKSTYSDTCETAAGSIMVASVAAKQRLRPGNSHLEKPNAHMAAANGTPTIVIAMTSRVLKK